MNFNTADVHFVAQAHPPFCFPLRAKSPMPTTPRTASSSSTSTAAIISQSPSTTATTSSMILSTAPSINPHHYAIHPHHHPPQNPLQSRTHRHPSMDSQRWNPVLAPLHLPQIRLLQSQCKPQPALSKDTRRMKLLDSNEIRQLRDVCIFEVNGIEVYM